jgi:phage repressor protein C with HTH and peptisase S24 domain
MEPHERLVRARLHAKFKSARAPAVHFGWPESTYRAHETGTRGLDLETALKYGEAFGVNGRWILYGEGKMEAMSGSGQNSLPNVGSRRDSVRLSARRLPVLGQGMGGKDGQFLMNGQVVDDVMCPPGLENVPGAYAVFVDGDSMEPRYKAGEVVYVHPNRPVRKGDYVVVQIKGEDNDQPLGYIKRYEAFTPSTLILSQHNPSLELEFPRHTVVSVHRIVFSGDA